MLLFINCDVVNGNHAFKGFDALHRFLQRLDRLHVEHRVVDALGDRCQGRCRLRRGQAIR
jgi:hypothetical protein